MEYLTDILADTEERIDDIQAIGDINEDLVKIAVSNLDVIKTELESTGRNQGILSKVKRQIDTYKQVARIPELETKFPIIREQMIVLMIGTLEVFIADVFRSIANNTPDFFQWNDPKEKVSFEPTMLVDGFTLGDVIIGHLKNRGYSFQDLRSLIKSLDTYCGIHPELTDKVKDVLIFGAASRHIIVHNRSKIDASFLNQIRDTSYSLDSGTQKNAKLNITDNYVKELAETIKTFCSEIVVHLMQRDE